MTTFYSHKKEDKTTRKIWKKRLAKHIDNVLKNSKKALYPGLREHYIDLLTYIVKLHDIGKYTEFFQDYLLNDKNSAPYHYHTMIGAQTIFRFLKARGYTDKDALIAYFTIFSHHRDLPKITDCEGGNNKKQLKIQADNLKKAISYVQNETGLEIVDHIKPNPLDLFDETEELYLETPSIKNYFTINYLFSLLTEADKLDASDTPTYTRKEIPSSVVENYLGAIDTNAVESLQEISSNEQDKLRNFVRLSVMENLQKKGITKQKIFTLTAPTGTGKTLASLNFALHLKEKIREIENYEPQIIYSLPFINIIEQGLKVYEQEVFEKEVANDQIRIMPHYQYADVFGRKSEGNLSYQQKLMSLDTWQADIIITSFVQFFETLITNKNKLLLKFNHLAGAIVILDEVQTLRLDQLPLLGATLYYLSEYLNTRLILMTATKPQIFEIANREILNKQKVKAEYWELLGDHEAVFEKFNRTKIVPMFEQPLENASDFFKIFYQKRNENKSCLIVCNTVKRSVDIFNELKNQNISAIYYLSTNIVPAERLKIIEQIQKDLDTEGINPVLVSTQVVEAGVDLDFDMGFRDLAPIDSIVQVAGRINRENAKEREDSPLYVIEFVRNNSSSECKMIYGLLTYDQVKQSLVNKEQVKESEYLQLVKKYFSGIADNTAFKPAKEFFNSMRKLRYEDDSTNYPVSDFKIIKEAHYADSVFIELNEEASKALKSYRQLMEGEIEKENFDRYFKRTFNQHIIAVPKKFTENLNFIHEMNDTIKIVTSEDLETYYDEETGFIREIIEETTYSMI